MRGSLCSANKDAENYTDRQAFPRRATSRVSPWELSGSGRSPSLARGLANGRDGCARARSWSSVQVLAHAAQWGPLDSSEANWARGDDLVSGYRPAHLWQRI